jgi:hypothetical protein
MQAWTSASRNITLDMQAYFAFLPSNWDVFHFPANKVADMHVLVIPKVHPKPVLVHLQN